MAGNINQIGLLGEMMAIRYLRSRGYHIYQQRWHCRWGEIDIVAYDRLHRCLVFIEVKTRRTTTFGAVVEAISWHKKQHLRATIAAYIEQHSYDSLYRFDAIFCEIKEKNTLKHYSNVALE